VIGIAVCNQNAIDRLWIRFTRSTETPGQVTREQLIIAAIDEYYLAIR
jgi:hypothetical protein